MMHYWGGPFTGYGFWGSGLIELLFTVLFWILIAFLVISLFRGFHRRGGEYRDFEEGNPDKALNILRERYAKGEINKKEFEEMKKDIS